MRTVKRQAASVSENIQSFLINQGTDHHTYQTIEENKTEQPPLTILLDANWTMMAMLNVLLIVSAACIMYHTEHDDNAIQKMQTLPLRESGIFFAKFVLSCKYTEWQCKRKYLQNKMVCGYNHACGKNTYKPAKRRYRMNILSLTGIEFGKIRRSKILLILLTAAVLYLTRNGSTGKVYTSYHENL